MPTYRNKFEKNARTKHISIKSTKMISKKSCTDYQTESETSKGFGKNKNRYSFIIEIKFLNKRIFHLVALLSGGGGALLARLRIQNGPHQALAGLPGGGQGSTLLPWLVPTLLSRLVPTVFLWCFIPAATGGRQRRHVVRRTGGDWLVPTGLPRCVTTFHARNFSAILPRNNVAFLMRRRRR